MSIYFSSRILLWRHHFSIVYVFQACLNLRLLWFKCDVLDYVTATWLSLPITKLRRGTINTCNRTQNATSNSNSWVVNKYCLWSYSLDYGTKHRTKWNVAKLPYKKSASILIAKYILTHIGGKTLKLLSQLFFCAVW